MFKIACCNHQLLDDFRTDFWEGWSFILTCENASVLHTANKTSHLHQIQSKPESFLFSMAPKACHTMPHSGDMGTSRGWYISIKTLWHWRSLSILLACCSRQQDAWAFESFPSTNVPLDHQPVQRPKHPNKRPVSLRSSCQKNNP